MTDRAWLAACSAVAVGLAVLVALGPLQGIPHLTDEVAYTLQSRLFAAGTRTGPAADNPSMVLYPFWVSSPVSYSPFPPGWPALLAVGERLGVPWLVNPLLAAALPPLTWLLAREWRAPARLAALVVALSPGVWMLAGSRMAHTSVLVALLGALVVAARARDGAWSAWLAGGLVAYVLLARHLDGVVLGGPLVAWGAWCQRRIGWVLPPAAAVGLVLVDNLLLTRSPWVFPMHAWYDVWVAELGREGCNLLGFGADHACTPTLGSWGHTPLKALRIAGDTALRLDRFLLGVPGGLLLAVVGAWRLRRWEPAVAATLVLGGYAFYWSPGHAYGARFWHPLYVVLPTLTAAGLAALSTRWAPLVVGACALGGGCFVLRDLSDRFWCVDRGVADLVEEQGLNDGVLFLMAQGERAVEWPALMVDGYRCDSLLEAGDGFHLQDPTTTSGGLQVRHALPDEASARVYMARYQPGRAAWLLVHDVATDERRLVTLGVLAPPEDEVR